MAVTIRITGQRDVSLEGETIDVGRDPACAIALVGDDRVEGQHAVIRRVAGRWVVEARGAGTIQVGDGRPTQMGWLTAGDVIRLSPSGPELVFEPLAAAAAAPSPVLPAQAAPLPPVARLSPVPERLSQNDALAGETRHAARRTSAEKHPLWWAIGGAGLLTAGTLLALFVVWLAGGFRPPVTGAPDSQAPEANRPDSSSGRPSTTATSNPGTTGGGTAGGVSASRAEPREALALVLASAGDDGPTYQLGTAWAISGTHLVTSGAIAAGLDSVADVAPQARVLFPATGRTCAIRTRKIHPRYQAALKEARDAQSEAESLRLDLEQQKNQAQIDALADRLVAAEERRFVALERQVDCDLALLEIDGSAPHTLSIAAAGSAALKAGSKITLAGVPFRQEDYVADPDAPVPAASVPGSVLIPPKGSDKSPRRWVFRAARDFGSENWSGAPLLDGRGQVVGLYSRPTPPPPDRDEPPQTHDIADVTAAADFFSGVAGRSAK